MDSVELRKDFLLYSNFSYTVPALVAMYRTFKTESMSKTLGIELISLYLTVAFFTSWGYHQCLNDVESGSDTINPDDKGENHFLNKKPTDCDECSSSKWPPGQENIKFDTSRFLDTFFANFAILFTLLAIIPLKQNIRMMLMIIGLVWIAITDIRDEDIYIITIFPIILIIFGLVIPFWVYDKSKKRKTYWSIGAVIAATSGLLFSDVLIDKYWLSHSLWHISGSLAASFFLLCSSSHCNSDLPNTKYFNTFFKRTNCGKN